LNWETSEGESFTYLRIALDSGDEVAVEPGSFLLRRGNYEIETESGGIIKGISRAIFGGESFFLNHLRAIGKSEIFIAPSLPGDKRYLPLQGNSNIAIKDSSFLAYHGSADLDAVWRGATGAVAGSGFIWLKASGMGGVWVSSFGAIEEIVLDGTESVLIDNDHIVAFDSELRWKIRKFGGIKSFLFGGERFLIEFTGRGRVLLQSRNLRALASAMIPFMGKGS